MKTTILFATVALLGCVACTAVQTHTPIDNNATHETAALYNRLFALLDKGIMLGHQDDYAYGHNWYNEPQRSDVHDVISDYPAMNGYELGHIELDAAYNLDSIYFDNMKLYAQQTNARGGILTYSWHGDNIVTGGTAWDCAQDSVVRNILPGGAQHQHYLAWLDRLADFFLDLKDAADNYIPAIFRLYHEHSGAWFWWGSRQCTPEEYKQLWAMTVEYLRDTKNVHNLLYAYSPDVTESEAQYFERYPGDEYVDIVGFDCYARGDNDHYAKYMNIGAKIVTEYAAKSGKIPAISETGYEGLPDSVYFNEVLYPIISQYKVSWVLFWRNSFELNRREHFYVPYKGFPYEQDFINFVNQPKILTNKDIIN
ncbi:mannan endo-1,4-beta-mannosidase [Bacteroidia bacterium]|nr:mannan endo-1,4-beta-mannosidase [Bacteroidia bacterium]